MNRFRLEAFEMSMDGLDVARVALLCALSGGVDSSVAAVMLSKAVGKQLTCVFVDHGLLRKDKGDQVEAVFKETGKYDLNFIRVNAQERFYEAPH